MTLVEILVTIVIMAILAAGLFTVSNYMTKQSDIEMVKAEFTIIDTALEEYFDFYGKFPDPNADSEYDAGCDDIERLYYKLTLAPEAKATINKLDASLLQDDDEDGFIEIIDPWGTELEYTYDAVNGDNFPTLRSYGPDKETGDADAKDMDDITNK